jgi:hypothetical protein
MPSEGRNTLMTSCNRVIPHAALLGLFLALLACGAVASPDGPTLQLPNGQVTESSNSMASFMYFIPLISPEPLSIITGPGSTQWARVTGVTRHVSGASFTVECDIAFLGAGWQKSVIDLSHESNRHQQQLKDGGTLPRQLKSIAVEGAGEATMEVKGTLNGPDWIVAEVRLRFNAHGQPSPVTIELCDIKYFDGDFQQVNALVAKVNSLTFRRQTGTPKMEVTVASIKDKRAGDSLWQNLKGAVEGEAANLFLPPLPVEQAGNRAMLDFGQALFSGAATFTFPRAKNLK